VIASRSPIPPAVARSCWRSATRGDFGLCAVGAIIMNVVKKRLKRLGRWLGWRKRGCEIKVFVDTAPGDGKAAGAGSGAGMAGQAHPNLLSRSVVGTGSFWRGFHTAGCCRPMFMPEDEHCGTCHRLPRYLPNEGVSCTPFQAPVGARVHFLILTIEHHVSVDGVAPAAWAHRILRCDDCPAVCPIGNKFAEVAAEVKYRGPPESVARRWPPRDARRCRVPGAGFGQPDQNGSGPRNRFLLRNVALRHREIRAMRGCQGGRALLGDADRTVVDARKGGGAAALDAKAPAQDRLLRVQRGFQPRQKPRMWGRSITRSSPSSSRWGGQAMHEQRRQSAWRRPSGVR